MRELTDKDFDIINSVVMGTTKAHKLKDVVPQQENPFLFSLYVPVSNDQMKVVTAANEIFHGLGVLPADRTMKMGEGADYCAVFVAAEGDYYVLRFNHPKAMSFKKGDEEYQFTLKAIFDAQEEEALAEEAEMKELVEGIKAGRLKSKSSDGYLVLKAEFYDAIESGRHPVEYRDFTEYNLKRTIGIKTVRFNRGYVKNAPQMKWEVKKIVLLDDDDNACDPFNVPDDFWPSTIAIHLGTRLG